MGARDPRVDAHLEKSADFARPVLARIREVVQEACPEAEETLEWGFPHFTYQGILCSMAAFKGHCTLNFWKGGQALAPDPTDPIPLFSGFPFSPFPPTGPGVPIPRSGRRLPSPGPRPCDPGPPGR
jgi:hypothetical protein